MEKRLNLYGYNISKGLILAFLSMTNAVIIGNYGLKGLILPILIVSILIIYFTVVRPKFGISILLIASYFVMLVSRIGVNFPVGTILDGIQLLLILGFFIAQKRNPRWIIYKNPITILIIIWIIYNILQVLNPVSESMLSWLYTVRSTAIVMLMYFIFMYQIRSLKFLRLIFKIWIILSLFGALYALKQEYLGFFQFEENYLRSDPNIGQLLFIGGHWRKFSIFSDPVAFSFNMVICAVFCMVMSTFANVNNVSKIIYILIGLTCMFSMIFSGTRAAYPLLPAGIILLVILKLNVRLMLGSVVVLFFFLILINIPTSNYNLYRFQTAFKPSDDISFNVRKANQKRIQPFIQSHPFGGGLGSTGTWGERFAPNSYLAKFPPDSGYVRVAVELGYVGLFLFCTLIFIIIRTGIINFYRIKNPELKSYCLAATLIVFVLHIANYPQEALVQFPISVYFYLFVALINVTYQLDQKMNSSKLITDD